MSSWRRDPEGSADALIRRSFDVIDWRGRIILANQAGALPALLAGRGIAADLWNRRLVAARPAQPWPPAGPFDLAVLRLPKAKDEQEMAMHACLGVLAPRGCLLLHGGNDEGIRSAAAMLDKLCGSVETVASHGHGRVVSAARPVGIGGLRTSLAEWRRPLRLAVAGTERDWATYPGIFASDRVDEGTALLLSVLPELPAGARVLDYGCGSGMIGAAMRAKCPSVALDLLDSDSVALIAAGENVPGARLILGIRLGDAGRPAYDAVLSNPPLHRGIAEDHAELETLIADAPDRLGAGGLLQIVVQRRVPLDRMLAARFEGVRVAAESGRYRVWRAQFPLAPPPPTVQRAPQAGRGPG
jgi:16S rRNA (guanine1207-N2)-methyltransferase